MKSIEVAVLNPEVIPSAEKMMVCAARLTQCGHKIKSLDDTQATALMVWASAFWVSRNCSADNMDEYIKAY